MPWLSSPVVNGVCLAGGTAGGTAGCEFKSPCWQLFSNGIGLDFIGLKDWIDNININWKQLRLIL